MYRDLHFGARSLIDSHVRLQAFDVASMLLPRMYDSQEQPHPRSNERP